MNIRKFQNDDYVHFDFIYVYRDNRAVLPINDLRIREINMKVCSNLSRNCYHYFILRYLIHSG